MAKPTKKKSKVSKRELTRLGSALRNLGSLGGGTLGSFIGQPNLGSRYGRNLGASISKWLGSGDYSLKKNTLLENNVPFMHSNNSSIRVRHREFLGTVASSTSFSVTDYVLNPGSNKTFPWLSQLAQSYSEYKFHGVIFEFVPTSGMAISGSNPALGSVMIQTDYRVTDSSPTTKAEMMNEYWACESVPSKAFVHPIECDPAQSPYNLHYVRGTAPPAGDSLLLYDYGKTHVATLGQTVAGNSLGDIWISYDVELMKPVVTSNTSTDFVSYRGDYSFASFTACFGTLNSSGGNLAVVASGDTIVLPRGLSGNYTFTMMISGPGNLTGFSFNPPTYTNCVATATFQNGNTFIATNSGNATSQSSSVIGVFTIFVGDSSLVPTITIPTMGNNGINPTSIELNVYAIPPYGP